MGVLIIIGFATVVVTLVRRVALPSTGSRELSVALPAGSRIDGVYGTANNLILDLGTEGADPRTSRRFMVLDPTSGTVLRMITVKPAAP